MSAAEGRTTPTGVEVTDAAQAKRLAAKANAGDLRDRVLTLTRAEAAYCVAKRWLTVPTIAHGLDLLAKQGADGLAHAIAYADLRERGFVCRDRGATLDVLPRGQGTGEPLHVARAFPATQTIPVAALQDAARSRLLLCVVDDDALVTHYLAAAADIGGPVPDYAGSPVQGRDVAGRFTVAHDADLLAKGHWGTATGAGRVLSATEAFVLSRRGLLNGESGTPAVPGPGPDGAPLDAAAHEADAVGRVAADVRRRGAVPKSGLRFGTHLRAYAGAPDETHADWLLHCVTDRGTLSWIDIARGVRLAHGVRKQFLVACASRDAVAYVHVAWFRP